MKIKIIKKIILMFAILFFAPIYPFLATAGAPLQRLVSINLHHVPTKTALHWMADKLSLKLVVSKDINGSVSLHLQNITCDQLIKIILQTHNLGERKIGTIIYIAPMNELDKYFAQEQKTIKTQPLESALIQLHHAKADKIANILKSKGENFLSKQAAVAIDPRTNSIIIKEHAENIDNIINYIKQLDIQVPQVLIAAEIVKYRLKL